MRSPARIQSAVNKGSPTRKSYVAAAAVGFGPVSSLEDKVDPIYTNKDPIGAAQKERLDAGSMTSVTKGTKIPFFFTMTLNGPGLSGGLAEPNSATRKSQGSG